MTHKIKCGVGPSDENAGEGRDPDTEIEGFAFVRDDEGNICLTPTIDTKMSITLSERILEYKGVYPAGW
ncbi:hypothetical protein PsorP6_004319 [Peronosclerospora sorghi]|uniref:Uncharacterized protein n=1 Tax=Peronosclerospora sorghi TaxID=230839 RepID=A0ACC0VMP2_9STRA|nr:hypothetical protein PsorP6_004319 [Peronosclerospora sorghi]